MRVFILIILHLFSSIILKAQNEDKLKQESNILIEVDKWVVDYLLKNTVFYKEGSNYSDRIDSPTPKDLERKYAIFFIGRKDFDTVQVSIYSFDRTIGHGYNFLLIHKKRKNLEDQFILATSGTFKENTILLYNFFKTYNTLPDSIKLKSYELLIINEKHHIRTKK